MNDAQTFDYWLKQVTEKDMPVMSRTASEIAKLTEGDQGHVSTVCDLILQDAAMTMHVLRLTESAYHMRRNRSNTISRALVMLGFEEVRSICLSLAVFRPLLESNAHRELPNEMARAFHAALQAMLLAVNKGIPSAEEIMIAALMHNLGEMVFWCFGGEKAELLYEEIHINGLAPAEAQWKVLGFPLSQLTAELGKKWGLGDLLQTSLIGDESSDSRIAAIKLGHRIAQAAPHGWDSAEISAVFEEVAEFIKQPVEAVRQIVEQQSTEAASMAKACGATIAAKRIPQPSRRQAKNSPAPKKKTLQEVKFFEPNQLLCMQMLGDTLSMVESGKNLTEIIETILYGICHGVGMDRALFAKVSPNGRFLTPRAIHEAQDSSLKEEFNFELNYDCPSAFEEVIETQKPIWVSENDPDCLSDRIFKAAQTRAFFCAPAIVGGQTIGLLYADRMPSKRSLDKELFAGFRQLSMQLNLLLDALAKQKKS